MPSNQHHSGKTYFDNLDGLRFFCFLSVFLFHSFHTEIPSVKESTVFQLVKHDLFGNGFLGVNFFFVLSGFLITYLLIKEKLRNGRIHIVNFWIRRVLRIWPLYFACVFYGFVIFPYTKIMAGARPDETANIWYYLGFISNFDYINKGLPDSPGLGVLWSVAIEEQFYLVWPVILSLFAVKRFWIPLVAILAGSLLFRALNDVYKLHEMHTLSCIGDMALGGLGAWLILQKNWFAQQIRTVPRTVIVLMYAAFVFVFLFRDEFLLSNYWLRVFERLFISSIMLFIILEQCYAEHSFYKMGKFKTVSRLGLVTYGLYCLHFILISLLVGLSKKLGTNGSTWQVVLMEPAASLVITVIVSFISFRYFEAPFLKLKERFDFSRAKSVPQVESGLASDKPLT
ncbi:MAG: acyltransferase [Chitinophagaceae bacterium]|nr:MAG: acyltransferase [Chitinophagaceae bacterium]